MPPTTGIGPGIERMVMIFTGQENIDDVIFFPMMRPAMTPLNASIYGVHEAPAPVEDLALSFEDFKSLCTDGTIKPHARHLVLKPHVRVWTAGSIPGKLRASGHVEIEGFLAGSVLQVSGFTTKPGEALAEDPKEMHQQHHTPIAKFLREKFPECEITVSPATVTRQG